MADFTISALNKLAHGQEPIFLAHERSHPIYHVFGPTFFKVAQAEKWQDVSFQLNQNDQLIAIVHCTVNDTTLSFFGFPIRINWFINDEAVRTLAASNILSHLKEVATARDIEEIKVFHDEGPINSVLLNQAGLLEQEHFHAIADLSESEELLKRGLRKSYKSLINWGKKNIDLSAIDQANPSRSDFNFFIEFYEKTAGGKHHSPAFWNALFDAIEQGHCTIHMGYAKETDQLISATVIVNDAQVSYYFLGAYDRDLFDKPIGHWPIFAALLYEKEQGRHFFDFGEFFPDGHPNPKEQSIGFFKKGFTKRHETFSHLTLTRQP